jgi:hypothetical protein
MKVPSKYVSLIKKIQKTIWLLLSSFGIMFAVLSWIQESGLLESYFENENKGVVAVITGSILYYFLGRHV